MKNILALVVCLVLTPALWAEQPTPDLVPVPMGEDTMPPALNQATPVTVPSLPGDEKVSTAPSEKLTAPPTVAPQAAAPAAAPTLAPPKPVPQADSPQATISAGELTHYFPVREGAQWTYEYLKPAAGQGPRGTYMVKCVEAKQMSNGAVRTLFESTENGQKSQDHYSLYDNKIEHMGEDGQTSTGDFVFQLPGKGGASWSVTESDGTLHKSKAVFGQAEVYKKTYPDCVVVTEKVAKGGKTANMVIYYYAKGIGLVSTEVYSPKMKLIQDKSVALVSGPSDK